MKCPFALQSYEIRGLNTPNIYPVIQWLVKKVIETRAETGDLLRLFSESRFRSAGYDLGARDPLRPPTPASLSFVSEARLSPPPFACVEQQTKTTKPTASALPLCRWCTTRWCSGTNHSVGTDEAQPKRSKMSNPVCRPLSLSMATRALPRLLYCGLVSPTLPSRRVFICVLCGVGLQTPESDEGEGKRRKKFEDNRERLKEQEQATRAERERMEAVMRTLASIGNAGRISTNKLGSLVGTDADFIREVGTKAISSPPVF